MIPTTVPASPFEQAAGRLTQADVGGSSAPVRRWWGWARPWTTWASSPANPPRCSPGPGARQVIDGHAPDVTGRDLAAYLVAGPISDHETSDPDLLLERRRLGMWILIREGSAARDLARALPFLVRHGTERTALCTDDRNAAALAEHHHLDGVMGALVRAGVSLNDSLRAATVNPATLYRLHDRGSVTPGLQADLLDRARPLAPAPRPGRPGRHGGRTERRADRSPLPPTPRLVSPPIRLERSVRRTSLCRRRTAYTGFEPSTSPPARS